MRVAQSEGAVQVGDMTLEPREYFNNMSALFAATVQQNAGPEKLKHVDETAPPHPTDTHPPLSVRLNALQVSLPAVAEAALRVNPNPPSSSLIQSLEQLEIDLSSSQRQLAATQVALMAQGSE